MRRGELYDQAMLTRCLPIACLAVMVLGCTNTKTGTFEVEVINRTASPLSVGLVKNGPPAEKNWDSPEMIAFAAPGLTNKHWGMLVGPSETRRIGPQSGVFEKGSAPFLRIYRGDLTINQLLAINRQSTDRTSVPLLIGKSFVTVTEESGRLKAEYVRP